MGVSIHIEGPDVVAEEWVRRVFSFAEELRDQGVHVGLGTKPRCVTCDEPWPCAEATG